MKKIASSVLGLAGIIAVTVCGTSNSNFNSNGKYMVPAESISLNIRSASLLVGETVNIETRIRPLAAFDAKLTFESSKSSVATVSNKGVVTAKAAGHTTISVYTSNYVNDIETPDLLSTVEIYVYKTGSDSEKSSLLKEMERYQQEHCEEPDNIILYDYRVYDLICDGVSQDRTDERQIYANSKSRGLMHYSSTEYDINVTEGGESSDQYGYICYTKDSYATYMYHYNCNVKNVYYIATEFNKGKASRFDTMAAVLDSYFSVSHDYFTGAFEDIFSTEWFTDFQEYSSLVKKYGSYRNNDEFCISYTLSQSPNGEFDAEDECRWATQLPAGIKYRGKESMSYTWVNGFLANMSYISSKTFTMDNKPYEYRVTLNQTFVRANDFEIVKYIPNDYEFNNVEYWYEI